MEFFNLIAALCLVGFVMIVGLMILYLVLRSMRNAQPATSTGGRIEPREQPRYDDPRIRTRGGVGRPAEKPTYDDPDIRSRGGFGRPKPEATRTDERNTPERGERRIIKDRDERRDEQPRHDDPDIRSQGSFGRDRD